MTEQRGDNDSGGGGTGGVCGVVAVGGGVGRKKTGEDKETGGGVERTDGGRGAWEQ